ncbi:TetR/AcrR family transcriptional regulator [Alicyclobacillus vulcanalis]|uniref:Transcriptional regulator, TetR family n=1 Tax=Alicyclobacillus vulcanalis TaxID=252246 RepID=A0A1N7MDT2_9BACL|nr:TetR/AcrR family transcriptional regulator [Alicyclobacillus vulcanalis]SIS84234.1 transcriptional regulator, TetR family [Alicyclobacillus vulcanalis]
MRDRIEDAAKRAFSEFGYKGTTMDQIARLAGVSKGAIYLHFPSKEALFQHMLGEIIQQVREAFESSQREGDDYFHNLERGLRTLMQFRGDHAIVSKLAQEVRQFGTEQAREGLAAIERAILDYLARYLSRGMELGVVRPCRADLVAFVLFRAYTAVLRDFPSVGGHLAEDDLYHLFTGVFVDGLRLRADEEQGQARGNEWG